MWNHPDNSVDLCRLGSLHYPISCINNYKDIIAEKCCEKLRQLFLILRNFKIQIRCQLNPYVRGVHVRVELLRRRWCLSPEKHERNRNIRHICPARSAHLQTYKHHERAFYSLRQTWHQIPVRLSSCIFWKGLFHAFQGRAVIRHAVIQATSLPLTDVLLNCLPSYLFDNTINLSSSFSWQYLVV